FISFETRGRAMRKLFHTAAAAAALLALSMAANAAEVGARPPVYAPPPIYVAPPFSWTGFYIGANIGGAWGRRNVTDSLFGLSLSNSVNNNGAFIAEEANSDSTISSAISFSVLKGTSKGLRTPILRPT